MTESKPYVDIDEPKANQLSSLVLKRRAQGTTVYGGLHHHLLGEKGWPRSRQSRVNKVILRGAVVVRADQGSSHPGPTARPPRPCTYSAV